TAGQDGEPGRGGQSLPLPDCNTGARNFPRGVQRPVRQAGGTCAPPGHRGPAFPGDIAMRKLILAALVAAVFSMPAFAARATPASSAATAAAAAPAAKAAAKPAAKAGHHHAMK